MKKLLPLSALFAIVTLSAVVLIGAAPHGQETAQSEACCPGQVSEEKVATTQSNCAAACESEATRLTIVTTNNQGPNANSGSCSGGKGGEETCELASDATLPESVAAITAGRGPGAGHGPGMGRGPGAGHGPGAGRGPGMGHAHDGDSQHDKDHRDFFFLIDHRDSIRRTIKNLPDGIETVTESDLPEVASMIQTHVESMYERMETVSPIRMRDPLFREIFANAKKIDMQVEHTDQGVWVRETSDDPYVAKLLQEHAKVVSLFIKNGYAELPQNHQPPQK